MVFISVFALLCTAASASDAVSGRVVSAVAAGSVSVSGRSSGSTAVVTAAGGTTSSWLVPSGILLWMDAAAITTQSSAAVQMPVLVCQRRYQGRFFCAAVFAFSAADARRMISRYIRFFVSSSGWICSIV